ncbi:MAG: hypothetical protein ACI399_02585 [Candidatus Cryptobacteroides sp.]
MKRLSGILPVALAALSMMISCSGGDGEYRAPIFKQEARLDFEILGEEFLGSPSNIVATDNYLLVSGYTRNGGPTFFVFDKNGNPVRSGINYGRGPAETISGYINMSVGGDTVQYNDIQTGWRLAFSLEEFLKDGTLEVQMETLDLPGWCTYAMQTPKGDEIRLISRSGKKDLDLPQRAILLETQSACYEYDEPAIEDREIAFFASLQRSIAYSPDWTRMVVSGVPGFILEIFSLEGGIRRTVIKRFLPPAVTLANGTYTQNDEYVFGGGNLCTTGEYIYSSYDGEHTAKEFRASGRKCLLYDKIAVFDWEGNPEVLYKSDYRIMSLSVENDTTVYACLETMDGKHFIGKASLNR